MTHAQILMDRTLKALAPTPKPADEIDAAFEADFRDVGLEDMDKAQCRLLYRLARRKSQAHLVAACEKALSYLTNINTYDPMEVARSLVDALVTAGANRDELEPCLEAVWTIPGLGERTEA